MDAGFSPSDSVSRFALSNKGMLTSAHHCHRADAIAILPTHDLMLGSESPTSGLEANNMSRAVKLQDSMGYPPRAMKADRAAAYLDMSRSKFLELVEADRLPKAKIIDGIRVWDRLALDSAFADFPDSGDDGKVAGRRNSFDEILRGP
jgi:hypothetical protein